ncbi:ABC-F family ATP-binding cassette domain-containing protein [Ferruginivarius sediminum]|uniref:ABC transporter ATP-binding protein n=1 Tax=Ferruginivarius sediminum TaxID=2661937 RepID=A0A369TEJ5_9PROT|nr:ABC-F family ATP-binding cassette domain-containing protein [Ferruginivarius sediminum]RDD62795.1 ABC transporter ATP-binding protein [Ferruginivarius sediminum]
MLSIQDLTYRVEGRPLLQGASLTVNAGEHVGLIGRNGSGKSTLLKLIAGELQPDGGNIQLAGANRVGRLRQEAPAGPDSLLDTVLAADTERTSLLAEAETATDPHRIAEIHARLNDIDAHAAPARAARILAGLGFDEAAQRRACAEFSGGWRMRVALAALLFSQPDVLLLDEPTNHLDLEAGIWLEGYLKTWPGTILLVSHDRTLLNSAVGKICHLEQRKLTLYQGGYDTFERTRRERLERQRALAEQQEAERKRIQAFVDRFRAKANKARQAQSRLKMLARMQPIAPVIEDKSIHFNFPQPEQLPPPLVAMDGASVGYAADTPVLRNLNQRIDQDDRIALLGRNGNGKTTFARLLADRLAPMGGKITKPPKLRIGYFSQDQAEELDLQATPLDHMAKALPNAQPTTLRSHLGRFGFGEDKAEVEVGKLSGGEKARLLFALMTRDAPQMLILDEPTNHLDIEARQALVEALNAYEGAVILVTHDPHLLELVADRLWLVADGMVRTWDGDLTDYRRYLLDQRREAKADARDKGKADGDQTLSKKDRRRQAAENRAATAHLRKRAKDAERDVERLNARKAELEAKLADPSLYDGPAEKAQSLQMDLARVGDELAKAEDAWLEAQEALEGAD